MSEKIIKIGERTDDAGIHKGLAIGMTMCIAIGIVLSELRGYYIAIPLSIVFGGTVGTIIDAFLERRQRKRNCLTLGG